MKNYYNETTGEYYSEGTCITRKFNNALFSGIPTEEQLKEWGFEEVIVPEPKRTLEDAKREMLMKITKYDNSKAVNGFTIDGTIETWLTVQERLNYKQSIESAKLLGVSELAFYVDDVMLNISTQNAEKMLASLQLYADQCYIVTKQHKLNVESLTTIEEVDQYQFKLGYPTRLNFDL